MTNRPTQQTTVGEELVQEFCASARVAHEHPIELLRVAVEDATGFEWRGWARIDEGEDAILTFDGDACTFIQNGGGGTEVVGLAPFAAPQSDAGVFSVDFLESEMQVVFRFTRDVGETAEGVAVLWVRALGKCWLVTG